MERLKPDQYPVVSQILQPISDFQPFCTSVLAGIFPGTIVVDDMRDPHSVCLVTRKNWFFLAGAADNEDFNLSLNQAIFKRELIDEEASALLFTCHPDAWGEHLTEIFAPRMPIAMKRRHYISQKMVLDWQSIVPDGFEVQPLNINFQCQPWLEIPYPLRDTLQIWKEINHPQFNDYGFVAVQKNPTNQLKITAWATVDGVTEISGDLGFETLPEFRRLGLGTALAAAAIEHGQRMGLKSIHWTCSETNVASYRIAQKLNLQRKNDYTLYLLVFDEADELSQRAFQALEAGNYQTTVDLYDRFFQIKEPSPIWAYIDCGRAYAALGKTNIAFNFLRKAVENGWNDADETSSYKELSTMRDSPEWQKLISEMET